MATDPKSIAEKAVLFRPIEDTEARILARAYLAGVAPQDAQSVELTHADKLEIQETAMTLMRNKQFSRHHDKAETLVDIWIEAIDTVRASRLKNKEGKNYRGYKEYD